MDTTLVLALPGLPLLMWHFLPNQRPSGNDVAFYGKGLINTLASGQKPSWLLAWR